MEKLYDSEYFSPFDTLTCGQVFRFKEEEKGEYQVIAGEKRCFLSSENGLTKLVCEDGDVEFFENYFDISRDYGKITEFLGGFEELKSSVEKCKGIRILRQNFEETLFSFIISANNNIKRIQGIIEKLSALCGENMGEYHAFPTAEELASLSLEELKGVGLGYRAEYIFKTARDFPAIREYFIGEQIKNAPDGEVYKKLLSVMGVGPKVANCIMLFGLNRTASYPVDTWIFKANRTEELDTPQKVQRHFQNRYGEYAGFAQQYIFHYSRNYGGVDKSSK